MATITLEVKVPQVVDTLTIELPYYCQHGRSSFAIMAENEVVEVNIYESIKCAQIFQKTNLPSELDRFETKPITREEFMAKLNEANRMINKTLGYLV